MLHGEIMTTAVLETNVGNIEFQFRDDVAPQTVQNFINYVEDGDYVNSIFHRLAFSGVAQTPFVLQGGGFSASTDQFPNDPTTADPTLFSEVPADNPVVNEFSLSNTRGTVAMAKLGNQPNSATNQYFINLGDNSGTLDNQNGGFTVFAEVVDMTLVDQITGFETHDFSSIFPLNSRLSAIGSVPFESTESGTQIVRIEQVTLSDGILHGTVFLDTDRNGIQDATDGGRGGVTIYDDANNNGELDASEKRTTTSERGVYHLKYDSARNYRLRSIDLQNFSTVGPDPIVNEGSIDRARNGFDLNFATQYNGVSYFNSRIAANVDGVNGVTPLDALLVINELSNRTFSDPTTSDLFPLIDALNTPRFFDVDNNMKVTPLDALLVINELNSNVPVAALSSSLVDPLGASSSDILPLASGRPDSSDSIVRSQDLVAAIPSNGSSARLNPVSVPARVPQELRSSTSRDSADEEVPGDSSSAVLDAAWAELGQP